ncbi:MAG: protein translocase subunit SecF [Gammaproteobacteria bacterium AqS3]|nr:protein translocase subunit SecF [Gammaproteobacteria bacterium AqS3]
MSQGSPKKTEQPQPSAALKLGRPILDFMRWRHWAMGLSLAVLLSSVLSLVLQGLVFGLDFTGGTQIEMRWEQPVEVEWARDRLRSVGFNSPTVTHFGSDQDLLIRVRESSEDVSERVISAVGETPDNPSEVKLTEFVGPQVGDELFDQGGLGLLLALGVVMVYIALRFQFKFAVAAVAALMHDVLLIVGVFSLMRWDFDLTVLAAVLAIIGYSLNDTIVVSDRIRENLLHRRATSPVQIINESVNQTLDRTLITSLTTMLVLAALLLMGGELIAGFAKAMIIGIIVGTYSSVYVAAPVMISLNLRSEDLLDSDEDTENS